MSQRLQNPLVDWYLIMYNFGAIVKLIIVYLHCDMFAAIL